jgi:hypothetical protein
MGVAVEAESVYGIKLSSAFDIIRAEQPPVCAASTTNPNSDQRAPTYTKNVLERRRIAESIIDTRNSPCTAASLGLSSLALRVGFATPGGMPSAAPSPADMLPLSTSMLGASVASSHMAHSGYAVPLSAMAGAETQQADRRAVNSHSDLTPASGVAGNNLFYSPSTAGMQSDVMQTDLRRVALACGTGGPSTADIGGRLFGTPDSELDATHSQASIRNMQIIGDFDTPGLTPISARRLSGGVGDMSSYHLQMSEDAEGREATAEEMRIAFRSATEAGGPDGSRRRVSFGPSTVANSRLSFSSAVDAGETLRGAGSADDDEEDNGPSDSPDSDVPPPKSKMPRTAWLTDEGGGDAVARQSAGSRSRIPRVGGSRAPSMDSLQQSLARPSGVGVSTSPARESRSPGASKSPARVRSGSSSVSPTRPATRSTAGKVPRMSMSPPRSTAASRAAAAALAKKRDGAAAAEGGSPPAVSPSAGRRSPAGKTPATGLRGTGKREPPTKAKENADVNVEPPRQQQQQQQRRDEESREDGMRAKVEAGERMVLSLLTVFGEAYRLVNLYQCQECIRHLQQLPRR